MSQSDFAFSNDIRAAVELRTPRTSRMLLIASSGLLVTFLIWAHFAVLDEVKRGNGRVVPSRQTQVVQSLEGGIISELLVQEGSIVDKDQPLARIEDTTFASQFGEIRERRGATAARVLRLEAEPLGQKSVVFPDELTKVAPRAVETERSVFDAHMRKIAQDIDVIAQQETQKQKEIEELRASETRFSETLTLLNRETALTRKLYEQKVVPEIEMLRADRQATDMRGQLAVVQATMVKTDAAVQEAHLPHAQCRHGFSRTGGRRSRKIARRSRRAR
jgi:adhesin transport system membrane fusion protein